MWYKIPKRAEAPAEETMAEITLKQLSKTYDNGTKALRDVDLTVRDQDFLVLLGPSGCGKTTLLRLVAGLEKPTSGEILFDGTVVNDVDPMKRNVSMVFQNFALYPHLNVYKNIAFPLKSMKLPMEEIQRRVEKTAEILDITHVLNRKPKVLSGGQRQRVALGRAMVREPVVFLLDEPLSNLDARMRTELRDQIVSLHERLGTTFLYVTHDQAEAMQMGSRVVVMNEGRIVQSGTPQEVYNHPNCVFTAGFVGAPKMNFFASRLRLREQGWAVPLLGAEVLLPPERLPKDAPGCTAGQKVLLGIRPEEFRLAGGPDDAAFEVTAGRVVPMGAGLHVEAEREGQRFLTVLQNHTAAAAGDRLTLHLSRWSIHVFDAESGENLCRPAEREELR